MHATLLSVAMLVIARLALAAPSPQYFNPTAAPTCPKAPGSIGNAPVFIPVINGGCNSPSGFCKRHSQHPYNASLADVEKRDQPGGLYMCRAVNWEDCVYNIVPEMGRCYDLCADWSGAVKSIGPDEGMTCRLFEAMGCQAGHLDIAKPGYADLGTVGFKNSAVALVCRMD